MMQDTSNIKGLAESKKKVFIMCRRGNASKEATEFLLNQGI
jgi:rhodanese-related sulfurtransferase